MTLNSSTIMFFEQRTWCKYPQMYEWSSGFESQEQFGVARTICEEDLGHAKEITDTLLHWHI